MDNNDQNSKEKLNIENEETFEKPDKGYKTPEELLEEIRKDEPDYMPPNPGGEPNWTWGKNDNGRKPGDNIYNFYDPDISKINPLNISDFNNREIVPPEYVVHPFLETQGLCLIFAAAGVGKTLFAMNIAYSIASGGNFLKYSCPKPRKVLYIDGEMKFSQIASRLSKIIQTQGETEFKENLGVLTPDELQKVGFRMFKVDDERGQKVYDKIIEKFGYEVIVIDNFSALTTLIENDSHEWTPVIDWFLSLRAKGKSVIAIHHAGKDKNTYRGSSKLLDSLDTAISLQPVNEDNVEDDISEVKKIKIVYQKARSFGGKDAASYEVTIDDEIFSYRSIEMSTIDKIIECLNAGMNQRDMARELDISQTTVNRLIKKARKTGRVKG